MTVVGEFNVKDYGAVGEDDRDEIGAFQDALDDAALVSTLVRGGRVVVPRGTYQISEPLLLPNGVHLWGHGPPATVIRPTAEFTGDFLIGNLDASGSQEFCYIEGIQVIGGKDYDVEIDGIVLDTVFTNSFIKNTVVISCDGVGIRLACTGTGSCGPIGVDDVWVNNCGDHGILVDAPVVCTRMRNITSERPGDEKACINVREPEPVRERQPSCRRGLL